MKLLHHRCNSSFCTHKNVIASKIFWDIQIKEINMEINNDPCYKVTKSHVSEAAKISKRKSKDPFHL